MNQDDRDRITIVEARQEHLIGKVDRLCTGQENLVKKIDDIMSNHLPHLKEEIMEKITDLDKSVALNKLKMGGIFIIGTLIGSIIVAVVVRILVGS